MKPLIILFTTLNVFSADTLFAQNIQTSTIEWQSSSTFKVDDGSDAIEVTKVVSSSSDIIWYNKDNTVRKTISITSSTGTWTNVSANGLITFNVTSEESSGIAQFWKTDGEIKVRIHLVGVSGAEIYELSVTNVEIQ